MGHKSDNDFANVNKTLFQHHNLVQVFLGEEVNKISAQSTQDPKCVRYTATRGRNFRTLILKFSLNILLICLLCCCQNDVVVFVVVVHVVVLGKSFNKYLFKYSPVFTIFCP